MDDLSQFYLGKDEPNRSCLLALRSIILDADDALNETRKYGMPCFCYGKRALCYLWIEKKTELPYMLFVEGKHLDHPDLESGERARMKILRFDPNKDLPIGTIQLILNQAIEVYRE